MKLHRCELQDFIQMGFDAHVHIHFQKFDSHSEPASLKKGAVGPYEK